MADPSQKDFKVPDLLPPKEIGDARLERRRKLRDVVEGTINKFESSDDARLIDTNFQAAFRMMTSPKAREAFDLTKETDRSATVMGESVWSMLFTSSSFG